ncbi:hypothetical protein [Proteiniphilum acetatigenes]|uniref:hypothetical protein n=1 Tax=Proteiniphilum acetatigenes TaxID=294710 RepID=UPI000381550A|nr:hypothetical protein [Proteiniphilum acetatigenes]
MDTKEYRKQRNKKWKWVKELFPGLNDMHIGRIVDCWEYAERDYTDLGELRNVFYWRGDMECHLHFENKTIKYR